MLRLVIVLAVTATAVSASAEERAQENPADKLEVHTTAAGEITFGEGASALGFRGQFLLGKSIDRPLWKRDDVARGKLSAVRPAFAIGATVGAGSMQLTDTMGDRAWASYRNVGVVAQAALRFVDGGRIDDRIYASFSVLRATIDHPTIQNQAETGVGLRASLGFTISDQAYQTSKESGDGEGFLLVLPHAWELVVEQDAGSTRVGFTIGYGL